MFFKTLAAIVLFCNIIAVSPALADGCEGVTIVAGTTLSDPTFGKGGGHNFSAGQELKFLESGWINPDHTVAALTSFSDHYNYPVQDVKLTNCHIDPGGGTPSLQPNNVSTPVAPPPSTPTEAQIQAADNAASNADSCVGMTTGSGLTLEGVGFNAGRIIEDMSISGTQDGAVTSYGEHGGYVYPAEDVKLLNCHVKMENGIPTLAQSSTVESSQIPDADFLLVVRPGSNDMGGLTLGRFVSCLQNAHLSNDPTGQNHIVSTQDLGKEVIVSLQSGSEEFDWHMSPYNGQMVINYVTDNTGMSTEDPAQGVTWAQNMQVTETMMQSCNNN